MNKPTYPLIDINIEYLIGEFGIDKDLIKNQLNTYKEFYYIKQHNLTGYNKVDEDFSNNITIWGNEDYYITKIRFSRRELISKLKRSLFVTGYDNLKERLMQKVEELKTIKTEEKLKRLFPFIHGDYIRGKEIYKDIKSVDNFAMFMSEEERKKEYEKVEKKEKYYYRCGLRNQIPYFVKEQAKLYKNMINKLDNLSTIIEKFLEKNLKSCIR